MEIAAVKEEWEGLGRIRKGQIGFSCESFLETKEFLRASTGFSYGNSLEERKAKKEK